MISSVGLANNSTYLISWFSQVLRNMGNPLLLTLFWNPAFGTGNKIRKEHNIQHCAGSTFTKVMQSHYRPRQAQRVPGG